MKNKLFFALVTSIALFWVSCSENDFPPPDSQIADAVQSRSLSASPEHFYYYKGKKIPLNVHPTKRYVVVEQDASASLMALGVKTEQDSYYVNETQRGYIVDVDTAQTITTSTNVKSLNSLTKDDNIVAIEYVIGDSILRPISNKFYIRLRKLSDISLLKQLAEEIGCKIGGPTKFDEYWIRLYSEKESMLNSLDASNYLYETGLFEDVDPGFIFNFKDHSVPSDPYYTSQWNLNGIYGIQADNAWGITKGSSSVTVAVVEQGINMNHQDLSGRFHSYVYNCADGSSNAVFPSTDHGNMVAGIIAANHNNINIAGVAPQVKLMNICRTSDAEEIANGIDAAWQNGADIINNSWGDDDGDYTSSAVLEKAISDALTKGRNGKGCVVVFSSGNEGKMNYPALCNPDILVVGATNSSGSLWTESDGHSSGKGSELDVTAPGANVWGLTRYDAGSASGTSYAAPHASGLAALILSLNSNLTQSQVNTIIKETARNKTWNQSYGWGIINAERALQVVQGNYSIVTAYPGEGSVSYAQQAKFYIPNLPASASVEWTTNSNAATIKSCSNDTVVFEYNFASRTMTDNVNATITYCGMTSQHTLPITVTNDPLITNVERMIYYDTATDRVDFKVSCTDPDATFEWSGSNDLVDFPYANDAMFMDHPNWYKSLMVPNYSMTYNLSVTATNQYGSHTYYFDYTHTPTMNMMKSEEEEEQEKQEEEQL